MVLLHLPRTHISLSTHLSFTRSPPLFRSQKERQMQRLSPRKQVFDQAQAHPRDYEADSDISRSGKLPRRQ
ncbi:hypothetical protein ACFX12_026981 [Malus domestica]